ncbi:MAG TPA: PDZ domain-containing protein [Thermoanaerobaculia bacterium]|nr:PDZ domain-containing protein [Thermoanaerobaculia bacterium]
MKRLSVVLCIATLVLCALTALAEPRPGWLGLGFTYHVDGNERWLHVRRLAPGGPAQRAGIAVDDVITRIDGRAPRFDDDVALMEFLGRIKPGQKVVLSVIHEQRPTDVTLRAVVMSDESYARWREGLELARTKRAARAGKR